MSLDRVFRALIASFTFVSAFEIVYALVGALGCAHAVEPVEIHGLNFANVQKCKSQRHTHQKAALTEGSWKEGGLLLNPFFSYAAVIR